MNYKKLIVDSGKKMAGFGDRFFRSIPQTVCYLNIFPSYIYAYTHSATSKLTLNYRTKGFLRLPTVYYISPRKETGNQKNFRFAHPLLMF